MRKNSITLAGRHRAFWLKISLILSLTLVIFAFRWTVEAKMESYTPFEDVDVEPNIEVLRTVHRKKRLPPPPVSKPIKEFIPNIEPIEYTDITEIDSNIIDEDLMIDETFNEPLHQTPPPPLEIIPERKEDVPEIFEIVEEMPLFGSCYEGFSKKNERKACSDREVLTFFAKRLKYPSLAKENGITGTVVLQFVVNNKGSVEDIEIIRDIGGGCGQEAIRVAKQMTDWRPGYQRARAVKVRMTIPIKFQLQ